MGLVSREGGVAEPVQRAPPCESVRRIVVGVVIKDFSLRT